MVLLSLGHYKKLTIRQIRKALDAGDISSETIEPITAHRWTEQFEALRMRTENYKQRTKDNVKVFLANMGPIPQHKPRADFSTGFFEVGAFEVIKNDGHETTLMRRRLLVKVVPMLSLSVPQMIHIQN